MARQKVFAYLRVSTDEQVQHGNGLDIQEAAIRSYCKAQNLNLVEVFKDQGISGSNGLDSRRGWRQPWHGLKQAKPVPWSFTSSTDSHGT